MYTGITKGLFPVVFLDKTHSLTTYRIQFNRTLLDGLLVSASVSVDGVCQTVVAIDGNEVTFQAIEETLSKTTLQDLYEGRLVSIERSARLGDENGGHELAGHILETGTIIGKRPSVNNLTLIVQCSPQSIKYIFEKGFIGLDGSSLTVGRIDIQKCTFEVYLIPETLRLTSFSKKGPGDKVNIEVDAKAVIITETIKRYVLPLQKRVEALEKKSE
ncbi:MAG: riboflavin synthase subunit alpha [Chthoniobacterales bacterium]